jgi:hypothetical protein
LVGAVERAAARDGVDVVEVMIDPELGRDRRAELRAAVTRSLAGR